VPIEFFVGRLAEVNRLRSKVAAAAGGKLQVAFLTGERGIGKSSLASFVRRLAEREQGVLGLHTFLGGVGSLEEMVRRVFDRLLKDSVDTPWHEKVKGFFGSHIREVGLFGISVEFGAPSQDLRRMVHDFAPAIGNLVHRIKDEKKGIFLILDDINGLASSTDFANWLKSLVDEIATGENPFPLCLLLVGLEERRQNLIERQPSLARVFEVIELQTWTQAETRSFFETTFARVGIRGEEDALETLARHAGGLPVLAHEIGDAAFNLDSDGVIDESEAIRAVIEAAEIVGRKHLEPRVFQAIKSQRYRSILRKLANQPLGFTFQRGEVLTRLTREEVRVFDNFLRRMTELDVIRRDPERGPGAYRFVNELYYVYFWMQGLPEGRES
jgi:AAA+ ATPase superfamily predicted ATPase